MLFGASTFIWTSPFSNETLSLIDHAKALGFDIIEICVEDPDTIDPASIVRDWRTGRHRSHRVRRFRSRRDLSADEAEIRENGIAYVNRCVDIAWLRLAHRGRADVFRGRQDADAGAAGASETMGAGRREPPAGRRLRSRSRRHARSRAAQSI